MDDLLELFDHAKLNLIEAGFWMVVGMALIMRVWRKPSEMRRVGIIAGLWFITFGLTDLIEIRTGAWYRPWWLLMIKALCVLALVGCLLWYRAWRNEASHDDRNVR